MLKAQPFEIIVDTMHLDIKEIVSPASRINLTHAVKHNDKYYCFFKERGLYSFKVEAKHFLILSKEGKILNQIQVPKEIEDSYYFDLFVREGRMLAKTYMDHFSFHLDLEKLEWVRIKEVDDVVYEGSSFQIAYLDFGEWGQTTWFIDQQTKIEYELAVKGTIINKIDNQYYLTDAFEVREIENPRNLKTCNLDYRYQEVEKERKFYTGSESVSGSHLIYKGPKSWDFEEPEQTIITSFVASDQLHQLYSDSSSTYVGKIEDRKLIPIQSLGKRYMKFNSHYSYRGNNLNNHSRFIKFWDGNNGFGFIEIDKFKIAINHLIHNQDSLKYLGSDGFDRLFNSIQKRSTPISLTQIDSIENSIGGLDMKDDRIGISHNGFYPSRYASEDFQTKRYIKVEDKYIALTSEYLHNIKDNSIKAIFLEWSSTNPYQQGTAINFFFDQESERAERFKEKFKEISNIISQQTGIKAEKEHGPNDAIQLTWTLVNGMVIDLYGSTMFKRGKEIRMLITQK